MVQWIDWTNNYYPCHQTRECEFYKLKGLWRRLVRHRLFSMRDWNIDAAPKRVWDKYCIYRRRSANWVAPFTQAPFRKTIPWYQSMTLEGFRWSFEVFLWTGWLGVSFEIIRFIISTYRTTSSYFYKPIIWLCRSNNRRVQDALQNNATETKEQQIQRKRR